MSQPPEIPAAVLSYQSATPMNTDLPCWRDGNQLVVADGTLLPRCCFKCGAADDLVDRRKTFSWYPRWVLLLILVNLLVCAIVALVLQKKVKVGYAVCRRHRNAHSIHLLASIALAILGVFVLIAGAAMSRHPEWYIFTGIVMLVGALVYGTLAVPHLRIAGYRDGRAWLKGAGEPFLQVVHGLSAGRPTPVPPPIRPSEGG